MSKEPDVPTPDVIPKLSQAQRRQVKLQVERMWADESDDEASEVEPIDTHHEEL